MYIRSFGLADMCLEVIVRNLEKFVFCKTIPQRHIDFLLRVYSEDVFRKYKKLKRNIKEDVELWFLNPHVKKVTVRRNSEKITKQLQIIGSAITSLTLRRSSVGESDLNSIICNIPCILHLDLSFTLCTDKTLLCIHNMCPDLTTLDISYCDRVTEDVGMKNLCGGNLSLKSLNISGMEEEEYALGIILAKMPSLECVKTKTDYLVDLLLEMNREKHIQFNLTELLYDGMVENHSKTIRTLIKICPKLRKLHFEHQVDEKALKACVGFQNLEELKIKLSHSFLSDVMHYDVKYDVLAPILPISYNLKTLILSCLQIPTVTLIQCSRNLEKIYLKNCTFTNFKEEDIKITETKLDTLVIKNADLTVLNETYKAVAMLISLSRNVTNLQLSHTRELPHEIFDVILNSMKNLTSVNFSYSNVKVSSLTPFFHIPSMKMVYGNYYKDSDTMIPSHSKSCTLSWRCMYDSEDEDYNDTDEDDDDERDFRYIYNGFSFEDADDDTIIKYICSDTVISSYLY